MVALSVGKKRKLGALSSMLAKTIGVVSLVAILASCGTSPGYSYTVGGTVSGLAGSGLVLQNNGGDDLSILSNGSFSFKTSLTSGTAYAITVKTQPANPSQTCTVSNGSGTMNGAPVDNVAVNCVTGPTSVTVDPSGKFVYAANSLSNNISIYTIDTSTGALAYVTSVAAGSSPASVIVDPTGKFVYVVNSSDNSIWAYTINQNTGVLTYVTTGSAGTAGVDPQSIKTTTGAI